ncbi:beta-lactamase family protein [bacterium]|nr:beta-lactamase family protein [bacterium]
MRQNVDTMLAQTREYVQSGHLPMVAVAAAAGSGLLCRTAYDGDGSEDAALCDRQYALASISKAITGVLTAVLVEQGVLDYEQPIAEVIPEFGADETRRAIRLSQIFNHSTGLPSRFVDACHEVNFDSQALLERLCTEPLVDAPGTCSRYTTHSFQLINEMIRRRLGLEMEQALQQYVCGPAGLRRTTYSPDPALAMPTVDHPVPDGPEREALARLAMSGGGLWSTLDDLLTLGRAWLTPGKLVSAATNARATALQPALPLAGDAAAMSRRTLGFNREQRPEFPRQPESGYFHGGATGTLWYLDPACDLVFVLLTNRWGSGNDHCFAVLNTLYA